jgi:hypothetical protein
LHKSDKDPLEWFKINDNFGPAFIEHLNKIEINSTGVILTAGGKGIAEIAIEWYRENHRSYIDTVKKLYTNVIFKIKNNLQKAAKATSEGDTLKAEGYNAQASLSTLLTSIAANVKHRSFQIPGVSPPSSPDSTQSVSSDAGAPIQAPAALIQDVVESIESRTDPFKKDMEKFIQKGVQNIVTKLSNQSQELASSGEARQVRYDENMKLANQYKTLYELHLKLASEDAPAISSTSQGSVDSSSSGNSMDEKNMESSITNISADSDRKRKHAQDDNTPQKMTSRGTFFDEPNESLSDQATSTAPHKKLRGESEDNPTSQTSSTLETDKTLRMKPKI